jgi:hypothetical protein
MKLDRFFYFLKYLESRVLWFYLFSRKYLELPVLW